MVSRPLWTGRIHAAWKKASIVWLAGVRRSGKTTLSRQLERSEVLNCDLPSVREMLRDPEDFFRSQNDRIIVLDEVHQLPDPSNVLKIAADEFPKVRILATGSSTLAATTKFKDTLTGRKRLVHLVPVLYEELAAFAVRDVKKRMLHGGLPSTLLSGERDPEAYSEWLDSFFARDVQELFHVEKRNAFLVFTELMLRQSGGLFEATSLARDAGISRPTVLSWLDVLATTHAITVVRPFHGHASREIVAQPKVYAFDTGFVCHAKRWDSLRDDDLGLLWEHLVLETLQSIPVDVQFWRDKDKREIDFVIPRARDACDAIECKWSSDTFNPKALLRFRDAYPKGKNFVVSPRRTPPTTREVDGHTITMLGLHDVRHVLA